MAPAYHAVLQLLIILILNEKISFVLVGILAFVLIGFIYKAYKEMSKYKLIKQMFLEERRELGE